MAGENYIGSKISLISLSDIRYVGILHSINAQDSTVGLKQVRSFGTEGRRVNPDKEILPSDNVFDYVVFRGSDIKDLQVFEAPPKPTPPPVNLPQDPAIMSMGGYPPSVSNTSYMQQPGVNTYWQPTPPPAVVSAAATAQEQLEKETLDILKSELEEADTMDEKAVDQLAKKVSELTTEEPIEKEQPQQQQQQRRPRYEQQQQQRGRGRNGYHRQYNKNLIIPNSEFDFEASNAKFDKKSEIVEEQDEKESEIEVTESEEFYDKKSSFFDNISCESKERVEQQNEPRRNHFHEERKLNMETFGQSTVDQSRYRNNYRTRGRGNHRGGYYRYNKDF